MARNELLAVRVGKEDSEATPIRPLVAVRVCTGAPQRRHAICLNRRMTALPVGVSSRELPLNGLVEVAGKHDNAEHRAKVADERHQRDAHGSASGAFIIDMNVGDREIRTRRVGSSAKLVSDHHAVNRPCGVRVPPRNLKRCAREVPCKSVLVQEHGAVVLGGDVSSPRGNCRSRSMPPLGCN